MKEKYYVAFEYTKEMGDLEGIITWGSFESREAFDEWYCGDLQKIALVVEEGISRQRCMELINERWNERQSEIKKYGGWVAVKTKTDQ